jgi:hypothetical protein
VRDPLLELRLDGTMGDAALRARKRRPEAARVERARIVDAVNVEHRHRARRREARRLHRAGHGRDRRDAVGRVDRHAVGHHGAVRVARDIDARRVDRHVARDVAQHGEREADVVHVLRRGVAAAAAGVPGQQPTAESPRPVGIDDHESLAVGQRVERGIGLETGRVAATTVKREHDRQGLSLAHTRRDVHEVGSRGAAEGERAIVISSPEGHQYQGKRDHAHDPSRRIEASRPR